MAKISSIFSKFLSLFLLLLHLGCFTSFTSPKTHQSHPKIKKIHKLPPLSHLKKHPKKALSSSLSFLKRLFSSSTSKLDDQNKPTTTTTNQTHPISSTRSSHQSLVSLVPLEPTDNITSSPDDNNTTNSTTSVVSISPSFFPLRNDIFPCTSCGEIFQAAHFLDHHQTTAHAVSDLQDGDPGKNIVHMIFQAGWSSFKATRAPIIQRVLKIHNSQKILARFEEYRELVKSKAAASKKSGVVSTRRDDERCMADGNELLRFFCSTFVCNLGANGSSRLCNYNYCSVCGIIRFGFSPKMDGIPVYSTSHKAHASLPEDMEAEFGFMHVKRAVLVCRVIAGRVGSDDDVAAADKEGGGFDSVIVRREGEEVGRCGGGGHTRLDEEELLVYNPRAVLPCFVIVYTV